MDTRALVYVPYYVKKTHYPRFLRDVKYVHAVSGRSWQGILADVLACSLCYKASFEDYFDLRLYALPSLQRRTYACTGAVHEFHRLMNSRSHCRYFRSKVLFHQTFKGYTGREYLDLKAATPGQLADWLARFPIAIAKPDCGALGTGVTKVVRADWRSEAELRRHLLHRGLSLLEEPIAQHESLQALNPSSVNTVRVITVLQHGRVDVIGATLRLGVGGMVDNLAAGGVAAPVDAATGVVTGPGVRKDIRSASCTHHPITGGKIDGFVVPHWKGAIALAIKAATVVPEVRTVGWDIAIGDQGALLVEGNDNWCKVLWQLPQARGGLSVLQRYM